MNSRARMRPPWTGRTRPPRPRVSGSFQELAPLNYRGRRDASRARRPQQDREAARRH